MKAIRVESLNIGTQELQFSYVKKDNGSSKFKLLDIKIPLAAFPPSYHISFVFLTKEIERLCDEHYESLKTKTRNGFLVITEAKEVDNSLTIQVGGVFYT